MNRFTTISVFVFFLLGIFAGTVMAKWSLLEDYQMADLAGDEGLCFASIQDKCDFEGLNYVRTYPEDDLNDDMDAARDQGYELISYDFSFKHPMDPPPAPVVETPVLGEAFFQSGWYTPGYSGWVNLWDKLLESMPAH